MTSASTYAQTALGVSLGIAPESWARLRGAQGRIESIDSALAEGTKDAVEQITQELADAIIIAFQPHTDSGDANRDPNDDRPRTIDTLQIEFDGIGAVIHMGGGAPFIEWGTTRHWVEPVTAKALHWVEGGQHFFSKGHFVSGIEADPFIEQAIQTTNISQRLGEIIHGVLVAKWTEGRYSTGGEATSIEPTAGIAPSYPVINPTLSENEGLF